MCKKPITLVGGYRSELCWSGGSVNLGRVPDETFDLSISIKVSGLSPSSYCTEEYLGNEYDIRAEGDTCIIGA